MTVYAAAHISTRLHSQRCHFQLQFHFWVCQCNFSIQKTKNGKQHTKRQCCFFVSVCGATGRSSVWIFTNYDGIGHEHQPENGKTKQKTKTKQKQRPSLQRKLGRSMISRRISARVRFRCRPWRLSILWKSPPSSSSSSSGSILLLVLVFTSKCWNWTDAERRRSGRSARAFRGRIIFRSAAFVDCVVCVCVCVCVCLILRWSVRVFLVGGSGPRQKKKKNQTRKARDERNKK